MSEQADTSLRNRLAPYGAALLLCVAAGLAQYSMQSVVGGRFPLAVLWVAVMVVALLGGVGPTLLATAVTAAIASVFMLQPTALVDLVGLLLYILAGVLLSIIVRSIQRTLRQERFAREGAESLLKRTSQ